MRDGTEGGWIGLDGEGRKGQWMAGEKRGGRYDL